jgi:hypothetical protein
MIERKTNHLDPENIAFEKYYYSQPTPGGVQDNNRLEDFFGSVENWWPSIVEDLERGDGGARQRRWALSPQADIQIVRQAPAPASKADIQSLMTQPGVQARSGFDLIDGPGARP